MGMATFSKTPLSLLGSNCKACNLITMLKKYGIPSWVLYVVGLSHHNGCEFSWCGFGSLKVHINWKQSLPIICMGVRAAEQGGMLGFNCKLWE